MGFLEKRVFVQLQQQRVINKDFLLPRYLYQIIICRIHY